MIDDSAGWIGLNGRSLKGMLEKEWTYGDFDFYRDLRRRCVGMLYCLFRNACFYLPELLRQLLKVFPVLYGLPPLRGDPLDAVAGAGDRSGHGPDGVRIAAEAFGIDHRALEIAVRQACLDCRGH